MFEAANREWALLAAILSETNFKRKTLTRAFSNKYRLNILNGVFLIATAEPVILISRLLLRMLGRNVTSTGSLAKNVFACAAKKLSGRSPVKSLA